MVGQPTMTSLSSFLTVLLTVSFIHKTTSQRWCQEFQADYCNMRLDNILMLDSNVTTAAECQALCFKRDACVKFSHFSATDSRRCVLFKTCSQPVRSCSGCVSGPPYPRISSCQREPLRNDQDIPSNSLAESSNNKQPRCLSRTCFALCATCVPQNQADNENREEEKRKRKEEEEKRQEQEKEERRQEQEKERRREEEERRREEE